MFRTGKSKIHVMVRARRRELPDMRGKARYFAETEPQATLGRTAAGDEYCPEAKSPLVYLRVGMPPAYRPRKSEICDLGGERLISGTGRLVKQLNAGVMSSWMGSSPFV